MYKINLDLANKIYFAIKELDYYIFIKEDFKIFSDDDDLKTICNKYKGFGFYYNGLFEDFLYELEEKTKINGIKLQIYIKFLQDNGFIEIEKHNKKTIIIKINSIINNK